MHSFTRRELLTSGVMGGVSLGDVTQTGARMTDTDAAEQQKIIDALKAITSELQKPAHSLLPADMGQVGRLRQQMAEFLRATNKWPDFMDVGYAVWFVVYDWHVRFNIAPNVVRLPDNRYGLTFMFTTLVLRPEQTPSYIGLPYDKER